MKKQGLALIPMFALVFGLTQAPAFAHGGKGECKADVEKFCKNVQPGKGAIKECLKANQDKLSTQCQAKMERMKQKHLACKADKEKFCKDVPHEKGQIRACMKSHENELSSACKAFL